MITTTREQRELLNTTGKFGTKYTCNGKNKNGIVKGAGGWNGKGIDRGKVPVKLLKVLLDKVFEPILVEV